MDRERTINKKEKILSDKKERETEIKQEIET